MPGISRHLFAFMGKRHERTWQEAKGYLASVLNEHCYVSFSAGKDSSVCAHLCHELRPGIPILMVDPGIPTHWTGQERDRWLAYAQEQGWNLMLFPWDKWAVRRDADHLQSLHRDMFADLSDYADAHGLTTRVMGLRADESRGRRMNLAMRGRDYTAKDGRSVILPIVRWSTDAVWSYICYHGLPWLDIYDRLGPDARNGLIGVNGMDCGRMIYLKRYYPRVWEQAKQLIQEAQDYV